MGSQTVAGITLIVSLGSAACAAHGAPPEVAASSSQTSYALDYPGAVQSAANDYVNNEVEVRRITADFPKYPDRLTSPPWPVVQTILSRADEAGRTGSYVEARRALDDARAFFSRDGEEIARRVSAAAQHAVKKKDCDVEVAGTVGASLKDAVERQLEKRLREHNEAHVLLERYREVLGRTNAEVLERQADDVSGASYAAFVRTFEEEAQTKRLLEAAGAIRATLDRAVAEERAFQGEAGRTAAERKASNERIARMEDGKVHLDANVPRLQALAQEMSTRSEAIRKEYRDALDALKKAVASKGPK